MKALLIEIPKKQAEALQEGILSIDNKMEIISSLSTAEEAILYIRTQPQPDLLFFEIDLSFVIGRYRVYKSRQEINLAGRQNNKRYVVEDYSLSSLEKKLDESLFYRANRKFIINVNYIRRFKPLSKSRVSVELALPVNPEILISRENSIAFK